MRWIVSLVLLLVISGPVDAAAPFLRDIFGGDDGGNAPPAGSLVATSLTATSGSSVTAAMGNSIDVPAGYNTLIVYAGEFPLNQACLVLYVKIDSTTTPVHIYNFGRIAINGVAGKTVAFGSQTRAKNSLSLVNATAAITVIPSKGSGVQTAPSGITSIVSPDQMAPNAWVAEGAHLYLPDEYSTFSVEAVGYRRDLFIFEFDGGSSATPVYHVHLPANEVTKITCRFRIILMSNLTGEDITVTMPLGSAVIGGRARWKPSFTPTASTTVSTTAALKAAANGSTYNDILLTPGVYDMSVAGQSVNTSNYFNSFSRTIRIRSTTGNPADVVFTGAPWIVLLSPGSSWVIQDVSWNLDGVASPGSYTGMLNFDGNVHLCNFVYFGANSDSSNDITQISWRATSAAGPITAYAAWGKISKGTRDNVTCNSLNSQAATLHMFGCSIDGNGPNSNDQLVTCHSTAAVACWGNRFGNVSTGNTPRIASDGSTSPIYLNFCYSRSSDFGSVGLGMNGISAANPSSNYIHFCDLPKCSGAYYNQYMVGSYLSQTSTNGPMIFSTTSTQIVGSDLYGKVVSATGFERLVYAYQNQVTIHGSRLTHGFGIANQFVLDISSNTTGNKVATLRNVLMRAPTAVSGSNILSVGGNGSGGTHSVDFKNVLIDSDGSMAISATAAASTSDGCRFRRAAAPTNWTTIVTAGTNTFSSTALGLDSKDVPVVSGNVDGTGVNPGFVGSLDIYGRPFLGGSSFTPGCAESTRVRSGTYLYPLVWN